MHVLRRSKPFLIGCRDIPGFLARSKYVLKSDLQWTESKIHDEHHVREYFFRGAQEENKACKIKILRLSTQSKTNHPDIHFSDTVIGI